MSQLQLANLVGVGRKWVVLLEKGNPTAEMSSVLKTIQVLGLELRLQDPMRSTGVASPSRLDAVFDQLKPPSNKP
ncbi:hypothetical protein [Povalibacter sp.]|uniref:hypothetical protein n=1 Tax=Povalibacter sp. TaxID=1962978 RepID=UPI002F40E323